jgi:phage terminase large subunit
MNKLPLDINPVYNALGNDSRYFIVTGGRGSGKSFAVNTFLAALTMERGQKILFTRFTMVSAATSIIPEFMEKIDLLGLQEHFHISKMKS